jgi:hypothetical protein
MKSDALQPQSKEGEAFSRAAAARLKGSRSI